MAFISTCAALVLALARPTFADDSNSTCQSYGVDYQDGGSYFQNANLNNTFTAFQQFSGCTNDTAHNVIVDPNGDQSECSQTSMQPSDTDMLVTCSNWTSSSMYSGDWSLLVVSNNGNGSAIAYQRDFSISVGQPAATISAAPTITETVSETTTTTVTSTSVEPYTTTLLGGSSNSSTTSSESATGSSSYSATDSASSSYASSSSYSSTYASASSTSGSNGSSPDATVTSFFAVTSILTQNGTSCSATASTPASASASATATSTSSWRFKPDSPAKIVPSVLGKELDDLAASIIGVLEALKPRATQMPASAKFRKAIMEGRSIDDDLKRAFVKERAASLHGENAIAKRHPDSETSTIETGTVTYTSYTTETATMTAYTTTTSTSTSLDLFGRDAGYTTTISLPTTITEIVCPTS